MARLPRCVEQEGEHRSYADGAPIDFGGCGKGEFWSAYFLKLGIEWERARVGELPRVTVDDIDRERRDAEHFESSRGAPPSMFALDVYGLRAYERRKLHPRERAKFNVEYAVRLVAAL